MKTEDTYKKRAKVLGIVFLITFILFGAVMNLRSFRNVHESINTATMFRWTDMMVMFGAIVLYFIPMLGAILWNAKKACMNKLALAAKIAIIFYGAWSIALIAMVLIYQAFF